MPTAHAHTYQHNHELHRHDFTGLALLRCISFPTLLKTRSEMSIFMATTYTSTSSSHSKLRSKLTRTKLPTPITAISCQGCYVVPKISTAPSGALTPIHNKLLYQLISPLRTTAGAPDSPCSHKGKVGTISRLGFLCKKIWM